MLDRYTRRPDWSPDIAFNADRPALRIGDHVPAGAQWETFTRSAPMSRAFNHLIAGTHFERRFNRWPLPADDPRATVNDFIFGRMIDPHWSPLHRAMVDKAAAKAVVADALPDLRVPKTLLIVPMDDVRSVGELYDLLRPFVGTDAIAKPTHASGAATFLRDVATPAALVPLFDLASVDYAAILREMQYHGLPRKVIVEALVPPRVGRSPDDYKFHCVHGEPLVCQVDHDRFGRPWSRVFRIPSFDPMDTADGLEPPATHGFPPRHRIEAMIHAARVLSAPFEFVRVDLYDGLDGVYFGEMTFTPAASLGIAPSAQGDHQENATHRIYSAIIMNALAAGRSSETRPA